MRQEATTSALEQVYRQHGDRLWRAVLAYSGDRWIADDAVSEAFAQALRRGDAIRSPERWVWKAAYRIAAGELQRRRNQSVYAADPRGDLEEPAWDVREALAVLPRAQRAAVVLHYYGGYPAAEIARITGSTSGAVWMSLSRGRRRLAQLLEDGND